MEEFIGDMIGNLQNFFLIYISHNLKILKKRKLQIPNKTNKDRFQRNMKHLKFASWKQPRGRPRFKENKFAMEEARKLLTPQRTLNLFPISYRLNLKKNHKQNKKEFLIEHTSTPQTCVQRTFQSQCSTRTHIVLNKRTQRNLEKASSPILSPPLPSLAITRFHCWKKKRDGGAFISSSAPFNSVGMVGKWWRTRSLEQSTKAARAEREGFP